MNGNRGSGGKGREKRADGGSLNSPLGNAVCGSVSDFIMTHHLPVVKVS